MKARHSMSDDHTYANETWSDSGSKQPIIYEDIELSSVTDYEQVNPSEYEHPPARHPRLVQEKTLYTTLA